MPIEKLVEGFKNFHDSFFEKEDYYADLITKGQAPDTLVIACSDSRNDPALLMQSAPGDLFVIRNVAAIVPPYQPDEKFHGTSAAIEFAVKGLKVKNIIVLGHALCGGVQALARPDEKETPGFEFLAQWIEIGTKARDRVNADLEGFPAETRQRALEQAMILTSLTNLMTFPWISKKVEARDICLYGWYFDMPAGKMLTYDSDDGCFKDMITRPEALVDDAATPPCGCQNNLSLKRLISAHQEEVKA